MTRIKLLVEGQTEEVFVRELLQPHYSRMGLYMTPIIVSTSPGYKGSMSSYAKVRPQIERLCLQDSAAWITTMFDLYALPTDFPGKSLAVHGSGQQKAQYLERQMAADISLRNFLPYVQVHEFEALLFSQAEKFSEWTDNPNTVAGLVSVAKAHISPEDINDSPHTAPSKRVVAAMPAYQKTFHGPLIACEIGLEVMRGACPHFNEWLISLENLVSQAN
jgi:hypothetical protein